MQVISQFEQFLNSHAEDKTQSTGMKVSIIGTAVLWLLILIFLAVSPSFKKPKKYTTVKITLAQPEISRAEKIDNANPALSKNETAKEKEAAAPKSEAKKKADVPQTVKAPETAKQAPKVQENKPAQQPAKQAPAPQKTASSQAASQKVPPAPAATKPADSKPAAAEPKKAVIKYKKSTDELLEEQFNSNKEKKFDDSIFRDAEEVQSAPQASSSGTAKRLDSKSALSGSAGTAASNESSAVVAQTGKDSSRNSSASVATQGILANIAATTFSMSVGNGLSSETNVTGARSNDGRFAITLSEGSPRILIEPKEPKITLSDEAAKLIDSSRKVKIVFTIYAAGNVPSTGIRFEPEAALPAEVKSEIRAQISKWRFAQASSDGQALFDYSIIKR